MIAHLIEKAYAGDFLSAVRAARRPAGGLLRPWGVLCSEHPDELIAVRRSSPLVVGLAKEGNFIASDVPAVLSHTRRFYQLADGETAVLRRDGVTVFDGAGRPVQKVEMQVTWDVSSAEKRGLSPFHD